MSTFNDAPPPVCAAVWAGQPIAQAPPQVMHDVDRKGRSALHYSAARCDVAAATVLIERGVNIRLQDSLGNSAVHYAVLNDARDVLNLLVRNQAPLNVQNTQGETPLFIAARQGDLDVVKFLLQAGANPNICNVDEASPLHIALANNYVLVAAALLKCGAHVNARDACGDTALHWAVREGHREAVQLLLSDYRCEQSAVNEDGEAPSDLALALNMSDIFNLVRPNKLVAQHLAVAEASTALTFNAPGNAFSDKLKAASMEAERRAAARPLQAAK